MSTLMYAYSAGVRYDVEFTNYEDYIAFLENRTNLKVKFPLEPEDIQRFNTFMFYTELAFLFQLLLNFITEQKSVESIYPIRKLNQISVRYFKDAFLIDFITLLPMTYLFQFRGSRSLYLLKCIRLVSVKKLSGVRQIMVSVKAIY